MRGHGAELRADFQQFYGLNLDGMCRDYTAFHAADLCAMLPASSRVFSALDPDRAWTRQEALLALVEYWSHMCYWAQTKDGMKGRKQPKPLIPTGAGRKREKQVSLPLDEVKQRLSRPRREVPANGD